MVSLHIVIPNLTIGKLNRKMAAAVKEVPGVQKRSRNLARYFCWMTSQVTGWKGRTVALYFLLGKCRIANCLELVADLGL